MICVLRPDAPCLISVENADWQQRRPEEPDMRLVSMALLTRLPVWVVLAGLAWFGAPEYARGQPAVEPIHFAHGTSSTEVRGAVIRGERALYSFEARGGQRLTLHIDALENNATFQVYVPGARSEMRDYGLEVIGQALPGTAEGEDATRWTGTLPQSGSYLLVVGATRGNATYHLVVTIC